MLRWNPFILTTAFLAWASCAQAQSSCADLFGEVLDRSGPLLQAQIAPSRSGVSAHELSEAVPEALGRVPEFRFIREQAEKQGIRVWLFGGTAASFLHYAKWDLARQKGVMPLQADRFDYDFTNIFRSTQDLDIVVDAKPEIAENFRNALLQKFPHFLGSKGNKWEVRPLRHSIGTPGTPGFKEAILKDRDFNSQDTDSNSIGMVELTYSQDPVVRDLKHWDEAESRFLDDAVENRISYFRSPEHFSTARARLGENPEILSVIRLLVKAFQYGLEISDVDFAQLRQIVQEFTPSQVTNTTALRRIQETASKLVLHAVNIEAAMDQLDALGLRHKLISLGDPNEVKGFAWWLNKEPLRSLEVGQGQGKTAAELGIDVVAHETGDFLAYESITRAQSGEPNAFISRKGIGGETAARGNGFYTRVGRSGERGSGLTIRFALDPRAREGTDFKVWHNEVLVLNKRALRVLPESLSLTPDELLDMAERNQKFEFAKSDLALVEKLRRKLNGTVIIEALDRRIDPQDSQRNLRLLHFLSLLQRPDFSRLLADGALSAVARKVFNRFQPWAQSPRESDVIQYIHTLGPFAKLLDQVISPTADEVFQFFKKIYEDHSASYELRREAFFESYLSAADFGQLSDIEQIVSKRSSFDEEDWIRFTSEIRKWPSSSDARKRKFMAPFLDQWFTAAREGLTEQLGRLAATLLIDPNEKNALGSSALMVAVQNRQWETIEHLAQDPRVNFNETTQKGFTALDYAVALGHADLVEGLKKLRPEIKGEGDSRRLSQVFSPMTFNRVEPGEFRMGYGQDDEQKVRVKLTRSFEMMRAPVTQWQYFLVTGYNPSFFKDGKDSVVNTIKDRQITFKGKQYTAKGWLEKIQPENPVETLSWDDCNGRFIARLNELSKQDDPLIYELIPDHVKGYRYRLPTRAEWEYVARDRGRANGKYPSGDDPQQMNETAWYSDNSGGGTHPVGQKKPLLVDGQAFQDLYGNVREWLQDGRHHEENPTGSSEGSERMVVGGGWEGSTQYDLILGAAESMASGRVSNNVGFRLVRTPE